MKSFKITKRDIILVAAVLLLSAFCFVIINVFSDTGNKTVIEVDGKVVAELNLSEDLVYEVKKDGKVTNTVEVKSGKVCVTYADCPDKICKNHRAISKSGESIVCLPNKVIVTISGADNENEVDGEAR